MADTKNGFETLVAEPKVEENIPKDAEPLTEPENKADSNASGDVQAQIIKQVEYYSAERPLPEQNEETRKECVTRTAYVKGFPLESEMCDLIEYFDEHEKVVHILMRKYLDKPTKVYKFKGSAFVTFAKREQCEKFLKNEKTDFKDIKLQKMWQDEYFASKKGERVALKRKKNEDNRSLKINLPRGAVVSFEGNSNKVTRELIKEAVSKLDAEVAYIDYKKLGKKGYIRLSEENSAKTFFDKLDDGKLKINDTEEANVRLIEGEEEDEYLAKQVYLMMKNRRKRKQGRSNRFQSRKRSGSQNTNVTPPAKKK